MFYDFRDKNMHFPKIISTLIYASIVTSTNSPRVEAICRDINYDGNSIGARPPCKEGGQTYWGYYRDLNGVHEFSITDRAYVVIPGRI